MPGGGARRAGFWIRVLAASLDGAVGFGLSLVLASSIGMFFARRAVVTLRIGEPGTLWTGPLPMVLGAVGEVVYLLPFTLLLVWIVGPLAGATPGEWALRLRVRGADGRSTTRRRHACRTTLLTVGLWGWTLALLAGRWEIAVLATAAAVVLLVGSLAALGSASRALHDRLSRTAVWRLPMVMKSTEM